VVDGQAWVIPAAKESGKTTAIAQAAALGLPVLSDDITIVDTALNVLRRTTVRGPPPGRIGNTRLGRTSVGRLGLRERWRMTLPDCAPSYPLGGFVFPAFGAPAVSRVGARGEAISAMLDSLHAQDPRTPRPACLRGGDRQTVLPVDPPGRTWPP
jgi:hypothetical protein